jgi:hypothetical protein
MPKSRAAEHATLELHLPTGVDRFVALATAVADEDAPGGVSFTEFNPAGNAPGYARAPVQFGAPANGQKLNTTLVTHGPNSNAAGGANWPEPTHAIIFDDVDIGQGVASYIIPIPANLRRILEPGSRMEIPVGLLAATEE